MNVLFTSAGRRVELLRAFRRAYQALNLSGKIIITDIDPLAPTIRVADKTYLVPRLDHPEYIPTLVEICQQEQIHAIFPLIDPDVPVLARHRQTLESTGARLAVIPQEAVDTVGDKWCTAQFFQQLGLTVPHSWLPAEINPAQMKYPLFIKPRGGSAAKYTFKIRDARELAFFMDYVPQPIIQEFLPGPEITSDICCDFDGKLLSIVSRQRIEVRSGEVAKGVTVYHQAITDACRAIARALPAVGPITVQCIMKGDVPHFTEINARLGGGLPLGIAAGVDSPRLLLMSLAGLPVDSSPAYRTGVYMTRFDDSFFLSEDEIEQITSRHI